MRWMVSEERLGQDQVSVIAEISRLGQRPIWIKGHAGSGKSIVLLYAMKDYLINNPTANVCLVGYTLSLLELLNQGRQEIPSLRDRDIRTYTAHGIVKSINDGNRFHAIFCDEVQDLPLELLKFMRGSCQHLILAGDPNQSIYSSLRIDSLSSNSMATVSETSLILELSPIEKGLNSIYRLKRNILSLIKSGINSILISENLVGQGDVDVSLIEASSLESEIGHVWQSAKESNNRRRNDVFAFLFYSKNEIIRFSNSVLELEGKSSWIVQNDGFGKPNFSLLNRHFDDNGIPLMILVGNAGKLDEAVSRNKIILTTYHSSKGLDFNYVYLPMIGSSLFFRADERIQALLLVALSRSSGGLTISYTGSMNDHFRPFLNSLTPIKIDEEQEQEEIF
jgi:superfamily I DNA/RNA helicase